MIRADCEHCSAWWAAELDGQSLPEVAASVEQTISEFVPPQPQRKAHRDYLVAAATVALAAGILIFASETSVSRRSGEVADKAVASLSEPSSSGAADPDLILSEGFETSTGGQPLGLIVLVEAEGEGFRDEIDSIAEERGSDTIFRSGLEVGGLAAWNDHS